MAITTLSMVLTVMVLNLHSVSERPVPRWVKIVVLKYLARLFCLSPLSDADIYGTKLDRLVQQLHGGVVGRSGGGGAGGGGVGGALSPGRMRMRKTVSMGSALDEDTEEHVPIIAINGAVSSAHAQETSFVHMRTPFARNNNSSKAFEEGAEGKVEEEPPDFSKEWHKLAEVVDRLFFWTFLIAILAISILLFHPLTKEMIIREQSTS